MKTDETSTKLKCVGMVNKLNSQNVITDAEKLHKYISSGDLLIKVDCIKLILEKENRPNSIESLIKETEEIYNFVMKSEE
jgi:hypothetical protein